MRFVSGSSHQPQADRAGRTTGLHRAKRNARRAIAALAVAVALLAAAGLQTSTAAEVEITIGASLDPIELTVAPGTQVTWVNADGERHRMRSTSGPEEFDSGNLEPGERFSFTFASVGSYEYRDTRNEDASQYHGRIVVTAAAPPSGGESGGGGSGSGGSGDTTGGTTGSAPTAVEVDIRDRAFLPGQITVATGGTVTWRNSDDRVHTATANDRSWDSGIFDNGGSYTQTFDTAGAVSYFCIVHPDMTGTVTVVDATPGSGSGTDGGSGTQPSPAPTATIPPATAGNPTPATAGNPTPAPSADSGTTTGAPAGAASVAIVDFDYRARTLEVAVGTTVNWRNDGAAPHTVTARDQSYDSGLLFTADSYSRAYASAGTFEYFCTIHPEMVGTVVVGAAGPATTSSSGGAAPPTAGSDGATTEGAGNTGTVAPDAPAGSEVSTPSSALTATATAIDFGYLPETIEIEAGTAVTWENTGEAPHTITARDDSFDSDLLFTGDSYTRTFTETGRFEYFCTLHPNMVGTIAVRERIANAPTDVGDQSAESGGDTSSDPDAASGQSPGDGDGDGDGDGGGGGGGGGSLSQVMLTTAIVLAIVTGLIVAGVVATSGTGRRA